MSNWEMSIVVSTQVEDMPKHRCMPGRTVYTAGKKWASIHPLFAYASVASFMFPY